MKHKARRVIDSKKKIRWGDTSFIKSKFGWEGHDGACRCAESGKGHGVYTAADSRIG